MVGGNFLSVILLMEIIVNAFIFGVDGLSMNYYLMSCPFADSIVKNTVNSALQDDPTLAAGLIRMHFHDCFIEVLSLSLSHMGSQTRRSGHSQFLDLRISYFFQVGM